MGIRKLYNVWKNGELSWKLPKKIYLMKTYGQQVFRIKNKFIKELQIEDKSYRKLQKEFGAFIENYNYSKKENKVNRTVWICWMQGEENAPDLVKSCIRSARKHLKDFDIIILSEDNIKKYITLPDHIVKKYHEGKITHTHFSDILRVAILCEHGGLWLDSTVLCTDDILAQKIIEIPLFVYKVMNLDQNDEEPIMSSSWLISAMSNNPILLLTRDILYKYWENHNYLTNFFLVHLCFALAARKYRMQWDAIPMYNNRSPHTLMFELGNMYDEDRWNEIKKMSSFHKLTRHTEYNNDSTFYKFIIDNN